MPLVITTFILSPRPTYLICFLDRFISSPATSPHQQWLPPPHLYVTPAPLTTFPEHNTVHLDVAHTRHPPTSAARSAPLIAACLRFTPYPASVRPPPPLPLYQPQTAPRSLLDPGGLPAAVPSVCLVSRLPPYVIRRLLSSSGTWFLWLSISSEEEGPGRLHSLSVAHPGPLLPCCMSTPAPSSSPLCCLDPIPVREVGGSSW